jgi:hypothetical protein
MLMPAAAVAAISSQSALPAGVRSWIRLPVTSRTDPPHPIAIEVANFAEQFDY